MSTTQPQTPATQDGNPEPVIKDHVIHGRDGEETSFRGRHLATASSQTTNHTHHGKFAPPGWKCSGCRWFEVSLYRLDPDAPTMPAAPHDARYVVHTVGRSVLPNEIDFARVAWADTPHKVLELLTMQQQGRQPRIPEASAEAVELAARWDSELDKAYDAWVAAGVR